MDAARSAAVHSTSMPRRPLAMPSVLLAIGASVALGSCRDWSLYDPSLGGGGASSSVSSSGSGSGGSGDGANGVTCALALVDTFNAGGIGPQWTSQLNAGGTISVANQKLVSTLPNTMANVSAYLVSTMPYELTGCRSFVRLTQMPSKKTKALALFALQYDADNAIILLETENQLQAKKRFAHDETILKSIPYDAVNHAYFGISELDGVVRWETSPDGKTWSIIAQAPKWFSSSAVYLKLGSSTYQIEPSAPGETHFDDVDTAP